MNRQQAAIKIAKVNRFIKQMNYWSELGENIHPAAFGDDIFTPLLEGNETVVFNCPFGDERKDFLRRELARHGYIARNTTTKQFLAIFDKYKFQTPVNWLKEQRQLGVLAKLGFAPTNNKNLWLKTVTCFTVNGKHEH